MNWDAIGAVGEIVGAIAVVLTLFYLAGQVRGTRNATNAETERQLLQEWDDNFASLAESTEIGSIMTRGFNNVGDLSDSELYIFDTRLASIVTAHYNFYRMRDHGFLAEPTYEGADLSLAWLLKSPGGGFWYKHHKFLLPHAEHVDEVLDRVEVKPYNEWWSEIAEDAKNQGDV